MDIKELNKTQLILLTLLITFVVSIATGIVTVSLMQQMPKSVPQTINNVIQRTIEKVTTVPAPAPAVTVDETTTKSAFTGAGDAVLPIYPSDDTAPKNSDTPAATPAGSSASPEQPKALGEGIIISDVGLILVDSTILTDKTVYKVILNKTDFDATILKKFTNGFTILKISEKKKATPEPASEATGTPKTGTTAPAAPKLDNKQ